MVRGYMQKKNTIIVACFQSNEDMENQSIMKMAKEEDKLGVRTLAIMTKPDLIQDGEEEDKIDIFSGKSWKLKHD